jgi:protein angel
LNCRLFQATSNSDGGYATVDYIFYSTVASLLHGKWIEGNLKLISRLNPLTGSQISNLGGLPSKAFPSDHICLVAKFLLKGTRRRN